MVMVHVAMSSTRESFTLVLGASKMAYSEMICVQGQPHLQWPLLPSVLTVVPHLARGRFSMLFFPLPKHWKRFAIRPKLPALHS